MGYKSLDNTKQKPKFKKGLWSPEEDQRLRNYVLRFGHGCWSSVPINADVQAKALDKDLLRKQQKLIASEGLQRNGKSCRLRWINYLRPGLKRGTFTSQEAEAILSLHAAMGNKWSQISQYLPGRTDNEIKNYWHSYLKKKLAKAQVAEPFSGEQLTTSNPSQVDSPVNSIITNSSFQTLEVGEGSSINSTELIGNNNQNSCLPKLLFAEWLNFDNMSSSSSTSNYNDQNTIQVDQLSHYHPNYEVDLSSCNFDNQDDFANGQTCNEELYCTNIPLYDGIGYDNFDSQRHRVEDQMQDNEFGNFLIGNEIPNNLFLTNNLTYI